MLSSASFAPSSAPPGPRGQDGPRGQNGSFAIVALRLVVVEVDKDGAVHGAGVVRTLDNRAVSDAEHAGLQPVIDAEWMHVDWKKKVMASVFRELVPKHVDQVRRRRLPRINWAEHQAVGLLQKESNRGHLRAERVRAEQHATKRPWRRSQEATARAGRLSERRARKLAALKAERRLMPQPPGLGSGCTIIRFWLARCVMPASVKAHASSVKQRSEVERLAMARILSAERARRTELQDMGQEKIRHDVESRNWNAVDMYVTVVNGEQPGFKETHSKYSPAALLKPGGTPQ